MPAATSMVAAMARCGRIQSTGSRRSRSTQRTERSEPRAHPSIRRAARSGRLDGIAEVVTLLRLRAPASWSTRPVRRDDDGSYPSPTTMPAPNCSPAERWWSYLGDQVDAEPRWPVRARTAHRPIVPDPMIATRSVPVTRPRRMACTPNRQRVRSSRRLEARLPDGSAHDGGRGHEAGLEPCHRVSVPIPSSTAAVVHRQSPWSSRRRGSTRATGATAPKRHPSARTGDDAIACANRELEAIKVMP